MPQMAPLNWLMLMGYFISILMILNSLNFYTFLNFKKPEKLHSKTFMKINWKWL
uniref:ATP synthase F0 subunit 8 n=1 Tax=Mylabris quadripunctata TaxID=268458 RepID=UPI001FA72F50|nr:ATP synthase F0 subunit 8 [Mylabris quadripunctata]UMR54915.1 ATP synthase F0 subunit 8 [Mylabris quadripunctata]